MRQDGHDIARLVAETASRLRLIQLDLADEDEAMRRGQLEDQLRRAQAELAPAERAAFLEQLEARFPSWDREVAVSTAPDAQATRSAADERDLADASFLVGRLVELAAAMPDVERRRVRDRLADAGLGGSEGPWRREPEAELRRALGLDGTARIDPDRLLEAQVALVECLGRIRSPVWKTWQEIAPKSRPGGDPLRNLARFLSGDERVGRDQIVEEVSQLQHRVASLILAVPSAAGEFERRYFEKLSAREVEKLVVLEEEQESLMGRILKNESRAVRCWKKYKDLSEQVQAGSIKRDILQTLADHASQFLSKK